ncbi:MAG: DUF4843 domain-containing protein [Odoribacteraceae bacterium]|jgi:hypothetical protein|nr:DUF4843 domain-containing protein [Odoribacteraceae bacterium]
MKKYVVLLLVLPGLLFTRCAEDTLPFYSGGESVYFENKEINFSFGFSTVMDSVIRVPVIATGPVVDRDRYFLVAYDSISGEEGTHFDPLPARGIFPAGQSRGYVPVRLLRVPGENEIRRVEMRLVAGDDFSLNLPFKFAGGDTTDVTRFTLNYSSAFTQPRGWMDMLYGYFSIAKYIVVCEITGKDESYWKQLPSFTSMPLAPAISTYINSKILAGREHALRDPGNTDPRDKGFMTMRGISSTYGQYVTIPDDWAPANE